MAIGVIKPYLRKSSTDRKWHKHQSAECVNERLPRFVNFAICRFSSGKVAITSEPPHAWVMLFWLFPIVFGINLIHFFDGTSQLGARIRNLLIICSPWDLFDLLILCRVAFAPSPELIVGSTFRGQKNLFGNGKCDHSYCESSGVTSQWRERREVREGRNEKCACVWWGLHSTP